MIVQVQGTVLAKDLDRVELMTSGGVAYELLIPLNVYESLPRQGDQATLWTSLIVREDGWQLYGFASAYERRVFNKVLGAKGVGPSLALGMLSTLTADRVVRAIREKDVATLQSVPRVGRKKAEQLILDLADKLDDALQPSDVAGGADEPDPEDPRLPHRRRAAPAAGGRRGRPRLRRGLLQPPRARLPRPPRRPRLRPRRRGLRLLHPRGRVLRPCGLLGDQRAHRSPVRALARPGDRRRPRPRLELLLRQIARPRPGQVRLLQEARDARGSRVSAAGDQGARVDRGGLPTASQRHRGQAGYAQRTANDFGGRRA